MVMVVVVSVVVTAVAGVSSQGDNRKDSLKSHDTEEGCLGWTGEDEKTFTNGNLEK